MYVHTMIGTGSYTTSTTNMYNNTDVPENVALAFVARVQIQGHGGVVQVVEKHHGGMLGPASLVELVPEREKPNHAKSEK